MKRPTKPRIKPTPQKPAKTPSKVHTFFDKYWKPTPIKTPAVDPELPHLNGIQRTAEVLRYTLLSFEWWISPNGTLREYLRINGTISSILLIPAVLILPLVTLVLWQVAVWIVLLVQIASNLIILPLAALAAGVLITGVVIVTRTLLGK